MSEAIEIDPRDPGPARYNSYGLAVEKTCPSPFPPNLVRSLPFSINSQLIITIIFLAFIPSARAYDGDEFTNNLFSDLAPILALFGEQVTKQFLSESSGIPDCILFSMAPLGVITAIVSVIRVAGQPWLKAIVGRGKEGRAQAELELMSSNSQDVGEMWNGQAIIRVLGTPSIFQFVYDPDKAKTDPINYISNLTDGNPFFRRQPKVGVARSRLANIQRRWDMDLDLEIPLLERSGGAAREHEDIGPPNISLNARGATIAEYEKWSLAIVGTIIQLSVLIYEGLISYHPAWRSKFPKNGSEPSPYAFPCTAVGTLSLNISMFACCYIIDCASTEEDWHSRVYRCTMAWIQKGGTVNDQSFKPYTIFGHEGQRVVTTSRRCGETQLFQLRYWVALFTFMSVAGFVVQFVGLRGMHWSATIAQLVATAILTFLRSFVRRHMLREPIASLAIEDYELDSMARRIGGCHVWRIASDLPVQTNEEELFNDEGLCDNVLQIRKRLGELSRWPTVSQETATSLCGAIEQTMNIIYQSKDICLKKEAELETELCWEMNVLTILANEDKDKVPEKKYGKLKYKISRATSWKPWELCEDIKGNIAGTLSLWTLHTRECDRLYTEASAGFREEEESWVGIDACARVLVWPNHRIDLEIFKLWRGLDEVDIYFQYPKTIASQKKLPKHRFTGEYTSDSRGLSNKATVLFTKGASLEKHLALQIFSGFLAEVVPLIDRISGETSVYIDDKSGKEIRNSVLTKLVEAVSGTGLGTKGELLLIILSHLGRHDKLPGFEIRMGETAKLETPLLSLSADTCQRRYRADGNWHKVASNIHNLVDDHEWQPSLNVKKPEAWSSWQKAARFCKRMLALADLEGRSGDSNHPQHVFLAWLHKVSLDDLPLIPAKSPPQEIPGVFLKLINDLKQESLDGKMQRLLAPFIQAYSINNEELSLLYQTMETNLTSKESLDILRVAANKGYDAVIEALIDKNMDTMCIDNITESLLFTAASAGHISVAQLLLERLQMYIPEDYHLIQAGYQSLPLIIAAINGHVSMVQLLLTHSPASIYTNHQDHAFILAARNGHISVVEELLGGDYHIRIDAILGDDAERVLRVALGQPNVTLDLSKVLHIGTALQAAAKGDHLSIVRRLMESGANANLTQVPEGHTALGLAALEGNMGVVDELLNPEWGNRVDVNAGKYGRTALQAASANGNLEVVYKLLEAGADINAGLSSTDGRTPLQAAAGGGHPTVVALLLDKGADISGSKLAGNNWRMALQAAAHGGHLDVVESLLSMKASKMDGTPAEKGEDGRIALQAAAEEGRLFVVQRLLNSGVPVNGRSLAGTTALQAAAKGGHLGIFDALLNAGLDVGAERMKSEGGIALQAAAGGGHIEVVQRLLDNGANVNAQPAPEGGRTALQAAAEGGHLAVVNCLLKAGARVNLGPAISHGRTALQAAAEGGHLDVVNRLLDGNATINAAPAKKHGLTALQAAASGGSSSVVQSLLQRGAVVDGGPSRKGGRTALQAAAEGGHLDIVNILVDNGADVNESPGGVEGRTALQAAAERGHLCVVDVLLGYGSHVDAGAAEKKGRTAVEAAAGSGHVEVLVQLLRNRINAVPKSGSLADALHHAAARGHLAPVAILLEHGAGVNARPANRSGRTALQAAAEGGHIDVVNILLAKGADVNAPPAGEGRTALQAAAEGGHIDVVNILLAKGADVNAPPAGEGRTALQAAAEGGHIDVVNILLAKGADVNAPPSYYKGRTALQAAAEGGHIDVVNILLAKGADVNAPPADWEGRTALQAAAEGGHIDVVNILLAKGADVNAPPAGEGRTALQAAAEGGHIDVVNILLAKGADVNAPPSYYKGRTALQAAAEGGHIDVVNILLAKGADVNAPPADWEGRTALQAAAEGGHIDVVNILLAKGADVNAPPSYYKGRTALQAAAEGGHIDVVNILLAKGADVNAPPSYYKGRTALQAAAEGGHIDVVNILLAKGADVNAPPADEGGRTALQAAAEGGHIDVVNILLTKGADVNAPPDEGRTALQAAAEGGHIGIVNILEKHPSVPPGFAEHITRSLRTGYQRAIRGARALYHRLL